MLAIFKKIIIRDLHKLKSEISLYQNEEKMWLVEKQIRNSAGSLCVHLTGSLNHFIGAHLGHNGYVRNREYEFSSGWLPKADLINGIEELIKTVGRT